MTEDVNKVAESSAAAVAEPSFNPQDQYTWSPEQREHWNKTGDVPVTPKPQESAPVETPAKEANSEPEGKTEAESETAPEQGKRKPGEKISAAERIAQLTAKTKELERDLERERSRATEPKPSTTEPAKQPETPKRPNPFNWSGTAEDYEAAMEKWEAHQKNQALQEFQRNEAQRALDRKMQGQLDEARAKYPDADEKLKATLDSFSKVQFPGVIRSMLDDTECFTELIYVLSDLETRTNFIETATKNPGKAVRVLAQMERDIAAASSKSEPPAKSESKPPAELKPRAPKPPSEVGGRGAAPEDELVSAARDPKGFQRFEAEMNRRKFAKSA